MRLPDRPGAETDAEYRADRPAGPDHRSSSERLSERLTRLLAGHPSADSFLNRADLDRDETGLEDLDTAEDLVPDGRVHDDGAHDDGAHDDGDQADLDPDDVSPDDLEPPDDGTDGGADKGLRPHHSRDSPGWDSIGGKDHRPYRPWFSADGASDPWFAGPSDDAGQ